MAKVGKTILCVIGGLVVLGVIGSAIKGGGDKGKDDTKTANNDSVAVQTEEATEAPVEQVLYDANNIKVTYTGFTDAETFDSAKFNFLIENNGSQNVNVNAENISVNGFSVTSLMYEDVAAGKKTNSTLDMYSTELEENKIDKIETIEFNLKIVDSDTYKEIETTQPITITLN